ncbi:uncharacterized protein LDX57_006302 [Aspergillus melleus]|uniref:uncharacterized protein n=1 Tax=Aspergillus melleus TaxID=138277 RepID=UPI001E8EBE8D|nr:uncharacterized protein LDX57_006302 [Aspergillus melleus]KAH8428606.1 hypothetical protein LDX57_006302 [Aspergillus melleus]
MICHGNQDLEFREFCRVILRPNYHLSVFSGAKHSDVRCFGDGQDNYMDAVCSKK